MKVTVSILGAGRLNLGLLGVLSVILASAASFEAEESRLAPAGCVTKALIQPSGRIDLFARRTVVATLVPGIFEEGWKGGIFLPTGDPMTAQAGRFQGVLRTPGGGTVEVSCRCTIVPGVIELEYHFRPQTVMRLNSLHVSLDIPASELAGQDFETDSEKGKTPTQLAENYILINKPVGKLSLNTRRAGRLELSFPSPTHVLFQDNRKWGPSFSIRMGGTQRPDVPVRPETVFKVVFALRIPADMVIEYDGPITITPGEEWIPLDYDPEIEPGTALDFSKMGFQEPPAGRYGRLLVNPDGFFAFEKQPKKPQRFYGVNLCFSAQYLRDEDAERLAERLARMGYNAVRLHHHDDMLVHGERGAPSPSSIRTETSPVRREFIPSLETPPDQGDAYGQRLRGYVHPPATGEYVFSIASDDGSELWLSTDDSPWKKRPVAWVDGWTGYRQFDKYPTQSSRPIQLESGRSYYMEVLHKEGFGGDHLSVAWKGPGVEGIIDGKHLSPWGGGHRGSILREVWNDPVPPLRQTSTIPLSEEFERLDRLIAALKRRGIYVSTDLYVSRRVKAAEIWPGVEGDLSPDDFKMAVPVNERAFTNWKTFANAFLTHRNPHTGLTYAEDPTLAWLCMINEGNPPNYLGRLAGPVKADWQRLWNLFLLSKYGNRAALEQAWENEPGGDPAEGTVPLWTDFGKDTAAARDMGVFCAKIEEEMFQRMSKFIREEIGCRALLTNLNGWTHWPASYLARTRYDYVDDHFYFDHPHFLEKSWQLPSRCPSDDPIALGAPGGRASAFLRQFGKPFTLSEYNYSAPGKFRAVGGLLTGSLAALQDWGGVWRFAYAHGRDSLFRPTPVNYFDIVCDPLNQLSERAALCVYLRRDVEPARYKVEFTINSNDLMTAKLPCHPLLPSWSPLAWVFGVGTGLNEKQGSATDLSTLSVPLTAEARRTEEQSDLRDGVTSKEALASILPEAQKRGWLRNNLTNPERGIYEEERGQLLLDSERGVLVVKTDRTAGGYGPEGETLEAGHVTVRMDRNYGTVWVSSLDGHPIPQSSHLLIFHLTDVQNSGIRFAEHARQTLLEWGKLPHLVRNGMATVRLRNDRAKHAVVYSLSTSGRRLRKIPSDTNEREIRIALRVRGEDGKAQMVYEVEVK